MSRESALRDLDRLRRERDAARAALADLRLEVEVVIQVLGGLAPLPGHPLCRVFVPHFDGVEQMRGYLRTTLENTRGVAR